MLAPIVLGICILSQIIELDCQRRWRLWTLETHFLQMRKTLLWREGCAEVTGSQWGDPVRSPGFLIRFFLLSQRPPTITWPAQAFGMNSKCCKTFEWELGLFFLRRPASFIYLTCHGPEGIWVWGSPPNPNPPPKPYRMNANKGSFGVVEKVCPRLGKGESLALDMTYRDSQRRRSGPWWQGCGDSKHFR